MKLYDSLGPNPSTIRLFIAERNYKFNIEAQAVDILKLENRTEQYKLEVNSRGELPALKLDSGEVLTEITAICEYLDEIAPNEDSLFGQTPEERARTRMWTRRVFLEIANPLTESWRNNPENNKFYQGHRELNESFEIPLKEIAEKNLKRLDEEMVEKNFIAGKKISMADILLFSFMGNMVPVTPWFKLETYRNIARWFQGMSERESAQVLGKAYQTGEVI